MQGTGRLYSIGSGMIVTIGMLIGFSLIFSLLLRFTSVSESSIEWLLWAAAFLSFTIGGITAGARAKEKGLLVGTLTAACVCLLVILYQYLGFDSTVSSVQGLFFAGFLAVSAIGAAIGVNAAS
ncbi:TIGR04086 family membrane protein [Bacillus piscicola]|uniref:TIGR04086 family membrane protein n=1 Tax=Bacillus piscicola TaxID=1632684 RepID=UPI001F0973C2